MVNDIQYLFEVVFVLNSSLADDFFYIAIVVINDLSCARNRHTIGMSSSSRSLGMTNYKYDSYRQFGSLSLYTWQYTFCIRLLLLVVALLALVYSASLGRPEINNPQTLTRHLRISVMDMAMLTCIYSNF